MGVGNRGESQCRPAGAGNGQGGLSEESAQRAVVSRGKDGDGGQSRAKQRWMFRHARERPRDPDKSGLRGVGRRKCSGMLKQRWWVVRRIPVS